MGKRIALGWLAASFPIILVCLLIDHRASFWVFSLLVATQPAALIAMGASRGGRLGPLLGAVLGLAGLMALVVLLLLSFQDRSPSTSSGVPLSSLLALVGLWALPLILTTAAYVSTFRDFGLREEDLQKIRRLREDREKSGKRG